MSDLQPWDPQLYADHGRFVPVLGAPVLDLLAPRPGERILDLGCGDGVLTERLVAAGCVVLGIDASVDQIAAARSRGLDVYVVDARALPFEREFDAVFSNATLHWIRDQDALLRGVARALKPGGRFVAEMGGAGNVASIVAALEAALRRRGLDAALYNPFTFPTVERYRLLLARHGFETRSIALFPRPTRLPGDLTGWLETFAGAFAAPVVEQAGGGTDGEAARRELFEEVQSELRGALVGPDGVWVADYVRLRFAAQLMP